MKHYFLSAEIWKLILQTFDLVYSKEELYEHFPAAFIDFVTADPEDKEWMNFNLFEAEDDADIDAFIKQYRLLWSMFERKAYEEAKELINSLEKTGIYHPYVDGEKMWYHLTHNNVEEAKKFYQH